MPFLTGLPRSIPVGIRRFGTRFSAVIAPLLRALGLEYINALIRARWNASESPKKVSTGSTWRMIARNAIHVIPMTTLSGLIWLNYARYFIGPTFVQDPEKDSYFTALLYVCAKLLELLCIASLAAIILHALRHELLGDGVPIGLLSSGIWFSTISAFWSPSFLGSFSWAAPKWRVFMRMFVFWKWKWSVILNPSKWVWRWNWRLILSPTQWAYPRRFRFYFLLIVCGLIAVTIGPASNVLMQPKNQSIPAGGVSFYLNGTAEELYPDVVSKVPDLCTHGNSTAYPVCASGGYSSLRQTVGAFNSRFWAGDTGRLYTPNLRAKGAEGNRQWLNIIVESPYNQVPQTVNGYRGWFWGASGAHVIQPHALTTTMMARLRRTWMDTAEHMPGRDAGQYRWTYDLLTRGKATSPFVRTRCTAAQNLTATASTALFPFLQQNQDLTWWAGPYRNASIAQLVHNQTDQIRTQWLPMPDDPVDGFDGVISNRSTTGLLVELPWNQDGSRVGIACTVAAAWHNTTVQSVRSNSYSAFSIALSDFDFKTHGDSPDYSPTNQPITLTQDWLRSLTPTAPTTNLLQNGDSLNTFESLLHGSSLHRIAGELRTIPDACGKTGQDKSLTDTELWAKCRGGNSGVSFVEATLGMIVADCLSRYASDRVFNMRPAVQDWTLWDFEAHNDTDVFSKATFIRDEYSDSDPRVESWMTIAVVGYAYYPFGVADHLALFGVCVYLFVASCHILYSLYHIKDGRSHGTSNAWETVTELLVLCQNSPPPAPSQKLHNTSAGIEHLRTYKAVVKIRAFPNPGGDPKFRLVLDDDAISVIEKDEASVMDSASHYSAATDQGQPIGTEMLSVPSSTHLRPHSTREPSAASSTALLQGMPRQLGLERVVLDQKYS